VRDIEVQLNDLLFVKFRSIWMAVTSSRNFRVILSNTWRPLEVEIPRKLLRDRACPSRVKSNDRMFLTTAAATRRSEPPVIIERFVLGRDQGRDESNRETVNRDARAVFHKQLVDDFSVEE